MKSKAFKITMGKGFHMEFDNGWTVSVQWGPGNYCDYHRPEKEEHTLEGMAESGAIGSDTCECAVFNPSGDFVDVMGWGDDVNGDMSANDVLALMNTVSKQ